MNFESILFKEKENFNNLSHEPAFFADLNLNIITDEIIEQKKGYNLKPFFFYHLRNRENIEYRQAVLKDIENKGVFQTLNNFSSSILRIKEGLKKSGRLSCEYQKKRWFLDSVFLYCEAVMNLAESLEKLDLTSEGLTSFLKYLKSYIVSDGFKKMYEHARKIKKNLDGITYSIFIKENKIRVEKYQEEIDYGEEILNVFSRFRQNEVEDYVAEFHDTDYMNHIESGILKFVAKLYSDIFSDLEAYFMKYRHFFDKTIAKFDREIQFYLSYFEYIEPMKKLGLQFCYPEVSKDKNISNFSGFDIALASKLSKEGKKVITNDFYMKEPESIFIVTGPNQGGKTTFARAFGQIHFLAALGLKVPGTSASLFLFDNIFTHFENEENIEAQSGKLEDDLVRVRDILKQATSESIIIMNEIFSSTALKDALFLGKNVLEKIIEKDALCVFVTFLDELASISEKIVSMISTVSEENVTIRTYKILRKPSEGISYAISIAQKHCLTYECLSKRLQGDKQ